jgi:uncharacterized membrane protein YfcA
MGWVPVNGAIVLGSAVVGLLVGMTGAGGGALMTPMLILLFSVKPSTAIYSDLVAALVMRPVGAAVHLTRGTVNMSMVGWLASGSMPAAFAGTWILHLLGGSRSASQTVKVALGAALLLVARYWINLSPKVTNPNEQVSVAVRDIVVRPLPTFAIGALGGLVVGITSVGAGSLMIVLLLFLYPGLSARNLVGTDITQAIPLTLAAALGALAFGHVSVDVTTSVVAGSVPGVLVGSLLSSRAPDRLIRPVIVLAIFASGLKYVGLGAVATGWVVAVGLGGVGILWAARTALRRSRNRLA